MVQLNFAIVGEGTVASVSVKDDDAIEDLKAAIAQKRRYDFPSDELTLFTTKRTVANEIQWLASRSADSRALQKSPVLDELKQRFLDVEHELDPASVASDYFINAPQTHTVHVLVLLPEHFRASQSRKRSPDSLDASSPPTTRPRRADFSQEWTHRFSKTQLSADTLPRVSELRSFVEEPLPEKISITSTTMTCIEDMAHQGLLDALFIVEDTAPCVKFYDKVVIHAVEPDEEPGVTEASFISHWDALIKKPLRFVNTDLRFDRDTTRNVPTPMKRPDFFCLLDGVCVFRGEEASPQDDIRASREQLRNHSRWTYGSAPYVLAYATSGYDCKLYALVAGDDQHHHQLMDTVEIASFRTKNPEDRIRLLLAMIQLTRLFEAIVSLCPDTARDEFHDIVRPNGVVIRLNPQAVEKRFPRETRWSNIVSHLKQVYRVIQTHGVPHTDQLIHNSGYEDSFTFTPRGDAHRPKTMNELFTAISQVLECLVALHDAGWMHRDLRWDNVMKRRDVENQWFVIDFADAAPSPKQNNVRYETLNTRGHAPEIFVEGGNHSTAVDLWSVGAMIEACELSDGEMWFYCEERDKLLTRLLAKNPARRPTATEALAELKRLQAARRCE